MRLTSMFFLTPTIFTERMIRQQMSQEPENSTAVVAVLSGLLAFIVILKTLILVVLFQRREIRLFGNCF